MRPTRLIIIAALSCAMLGCSRTKSEPKPATPSALAPAPAQPPPPPPPPKPAEPVLVDSLPPLRVVNGDGITLTETVDHRIKVQTTALWNEPIVTTFDDCDYFRRAIPILQRQMTKERGKLLETMCVVEKKTAGKSASKTAKAASVKPAH
jgi:hypothetical protein